MDKFRFENKYFKMTAKRKDMSDRSNSIQQPLCVKITLGSLRPKGIYLLIMTSQ